MSEVVEEVFSVVKSEVINDVVSVVTEVSEVAEDVFSVVTELSEVVGNGVSVVTSESSNSKKYVKSSYAKKDKIHLLTTILPSICVLIVPNFII